MKVNLNLIPIVYYQDSINVLLANHHNQRNLIQITAKQSILNTIQSFMQSTFQITIEPAQIITHLSTLWQPELTIDCQIQITIDQLNQLENVLRLDHNYLFDDIDHLINITSEQKQIIQTNRQILIDQYQLYRLQAVHFMLPPQFTTYYLSSFLTMLTNTPIKPNNLKYHFADQIKLLKKDRSKKGRPKAIFQYQAK